MKTITKNNQNAERSEGVKRPRSGADDLRVLDAEDGVGPAAGIVVVGRCGDSIGDAFFQ